MVYSRVPPVTTFPSTVAIHGMSLTDVTVTVTLWLTWSSPSEARKVRFSSPNQFSAGVRVTEPVTGSISTTRLTGSSARVHVRVSPSGSMKALERSSHSVSTVSSSNSGSGRSSLTRGGAFLTIAHANAGGPSSRPSKARTSTDQFSPFLVLK